MTQTNAKTQMPFCANGCGKQMSKSGWTSKKLAQDPNAFSGWKCIDCKKGIKPSETPKQEESKPYWCDECKMYKVLGYCPEHGLTKEETKEEEKITMEEIKKPFIDSNGMKQYIPLMNGNYIPRLVGSGDITDTQLLETIYANREYPLYRGILIEGETGSGKTHFVRHFCWDKKLPYMRVNVNGATTPEDMIGQFVPSEKGFVWVDGVLTKFMRHGGIFVVDEINMAQADILALLNPIMDDERKLVLVQKDGEVIHAHKDFFLIATMNPDYEGTKPLNEALRDRFITIEFGYNLDAEKKLIKNKELLDLANKLRKMKMEGQLDTPISTRAMMLFMKNTETLGEDMALELLLQRFQAVERKVVRETAEMIFSRKDKIEDYTQ